MAEYQREWKARLVANPKAHAAWKAKKAAKARSTKRSTSPSTQTKRKEDTKRLTESYVRHVLSIECGCSRNEIPAELVEIKRLQLQLFRKTKTKKEPTNHDQSPTTPQRPRRKNG